MPGSSSENEMLSIEVDEDSEAEVSELKKRAAKEPPATKEEPTPVVQMGRDGAGISFRKQASRGKQRNVL